MTGAAVLLAALALFGVLVYLCGSEDGVAKPDPMKVVEDGLHLRDLLPGGNPAGLHDDLP
ncbi:hypothetical protein Afil01_18840 [Actinorhabdospora filicis]|uniref:Uncharacterized protein n=1 Tax=Actinorhabdospora filicis TaxID=1785913 RepID=A0A9W6W2J3_9ACTN|nr:hypothetical protein [Actinorhabdospora filicis]GLZ77077.1 hypothetical protein Afil01_18840 [Actinorhabdospora filicis]